MEFYGDTLESIREFDPDSQRSITKRDQCQLVPMKELATVKADFLAWAKAAKERWTEDRFAYGLRGRLEFAERGEQFPDWEYLLPLVRPLDGSIFDYLTDMLLVVDEPAAVEQMIGTYRKNLSQRFRGADDAGELVLSPEFFIHPVELLRERIEASQRVEIRVLGVQAAMVDTGFLTDGSELRSLGSLGSLGSQNPENRVSGSGFRVPGLETSNQSESQDENLETPKTPETLQTPETPLYLFPLEANQPEIRFKVQQGRRYHGRIQQLVQGLREIRQKGETTLLVMPSLGVAERVADMLKEYEVNALLFPEPTQLMASDSVFAKASCVVTVGGVVSGFDAPNFGLHVIVERDIFDEAASVEEVRLTPGGKTRRKTSLSSFLSDFRDLKIGDYVVHVDHGIGRYRGLQQIQVDPRQPAHEFMLLTYADDAKLFVPVERLDLVQKYSSAETGQAPQLDKLGGIGWAKTKAKVKRAMRDMAEELLKLYAERRLVRGHAFSPDGPWQQEFEEAFPFELTQDQAQAVTEIKTDLETDGPMDRLLCGDVGFGKTEVAMRAAFKAVMDSKQVAVLTPTTVLAYQHWKTFRERFASFPVNIEMVSRFRTPKEQKQTVERLARGEVDILVGTHRILSKDVEFRDLGLVVIDEEQRFGVAHKEKLKHLRRKVDVLTLSATPIPRTLNMSLAGLRDMSVIETPPRDRLPIHTVVAQFSEPVVKGAVDLELARGGQVFFVHNRVESINTIAALLQRLVPQARIGVGHGQMGEKDLESVMMKFVQHEFDILVSTTIIENGIDIPLANTIIINHAEHYGLAQLYQLRGRVGRSSRRAYAYLLIPPEGQLSQISRQRLAAIREYSDLGAGFRIAALDLELRGAGNMLGGEQSGFLDSVGFDLYCQMLDHTVKELRGTVTEDDVNTAINLKFDIRLPESYIEDVGQRLRTYKRISSAANDMVLEKLGQELDDRYGPRPEQVENLFEYSRLRRKASPMGVVSMDFEGGVLMVKFSDKARIDKEKLLAFIGARKNISFSPTGLLKIPIQATGRSQLFAGVHEFLNAVCLDEPAD
ncbi:MAG: transcription-repair coupling factor [Blastocatellia bacterium]|nr:transcription-repair coupling factor [Blastocatellia bacterium]